jgi:hypothetical protein
VNSTILPALVSSAKASGEESVLLTVETPAVVSTALRIHPSTDLRGLFIPNTVEKEEAVLESRWGGLEKPVAPSRKTPTAMAKRREYTVGAAMVQSDSMKLLFAFCFVNEITFSALG